MLRLYTYNTRGTAVPVKSSPGMNPKHQYSRVQERGQENKAAALHVSTDQVTALQFGRRTCARSCPTSERYSQFRQGRKSLRVMDEAADSVPQVSDM